MHQAWSLFGGTTLLRRKRQKKNLALTEVLMIYEANTQSVTLAPEITPELTASISTAFSQALAYFPILPSMALEEVPGVTETICV
jgi:hypothetical protein